MRDLKLDLSRGVAVLSIDRPQARNALALQTMAELDQRLASLRTGRVRMLLAGRVFAAPEALETGLVEEVVASEELDGRLAEVARAIAAAPPLAVAGIKRSVDSVRPHRHPELAQAAIATFTKTWVAPAHWRAVERMERSRKKKA